MQRKVLSGRDPAARLGLRQYHIGGDILRLRGAPSLRSKGWAATETGSIRPPTLSFGKDGAPNAIRHSAVSAVMVTLTALKAGVRDSGSAAAVTNTLASGKYMAALPARMGNSRTRIASI